MASTQPPAHDPALASASNATQSTPATQPAAGTLPTSFPSSLLANVGQEQLAEILKHIPGLLNRGEAKDSAAAEALSHLSQGFQPVGQNFPHGLLPGQLPLQHNAMASEPGPSSHPRGPPNLGQLSAVASAIQATVHQAQQAAAAAAAADAHPPEQDGGSPQPPDSPGEGSEKPASGKTSGRRGGRSAAMSNDEWARIRKDNHKEVERRRRGNINEGINELGRIVPNGSGEKAKGAILSRAVQYIHHLKENEARNIEKWTLEKLLMDQAMGDLQAQLEEMRRMWDEERVARQRAEAELELLRGHKAGTAGAAAPAAASGSAPSGAAAAAPAPAAAAPAAPSAEKDAAKRVREEGDNEGEAPAAVEGDDRSKRKRTE
ncbi:hypothetical protein L227DRAFT_521541 [Lentinus tigrinus ALCF2SS1-6]|uniref:BHLH domain-containing protein n=1 Tax=Lentinus tigrinus ALCF2SS1-6 TaxID=1328759 RepID=A0A5C2SJQ1_9APHY|nr:hypothetical protein L227DRAFT_521541 [Lentinus tigrinus ALCF2SS1-6]